MQFEKFIKTYLEGDVQYLPDYLNVDCNTSESLVNLYYIDSLDLFELIDKFCDDYCVPKSIFFSAAGFARFFNDFQEFTGNYCRLGNNFYAKSDLFDIEFYLENVANF